MKAKILKITTKLKYQHFLVGLILLNLVLIVFPGIPLSNNTEAKADSYINYYEQRFNYYTESNEISDLTAMRLNQLGVQPTAAVLGTTVEQPTIAEGTPTPTPTKVFVVQPVPGTDNTCPQTTQRCVPCNAGEPACRVTAGATVGYKGWACQNNNPGNIRYSASRINLIVQYGGIAPCGSKGPSPDSQYMVFTSYDIGRNALRSYIKAIAAGGHSAYNPECASGECNLRFFFSKYAPAGDQNDPDSYSSYVAGYIGVDADTTTLSWIVSNKLELMIDAIQNHEGWFVQ